MDLDTGMIYGIGTRTAPIVALIYRIERWNGVNRALAIKQAVNLAAQNVTVTADLKHWVIDDPDMIHVLSDRLD